MAPDWFLSLLPCCPLDGELWAGRGNFQLCRSICARDAPDPRFDRIQYAVYSTPALPYVFADGEIKNANMHRQLKLAEVESWIDSRLVGLPDFASIETPATFDGELAFLCENIPVQDDRVFLHRQVKLPDNEADARERTNAFLEKVLERAGEGVVIRDPQASWFPRRKAAGAKREVIGRRSQPDIRGDSCQNLQRHGKTGNAEVLDTVPATELAKRWDGWGSSLKPAWEPIVLAMRPLDGTFAENAHRYGVAGLNIDASRIGVGKGGRRDGEKTADRRYADRGATNFAPTPGPRGGDAKGRWPANLLLDEVSGEMLNRQSGVTKSGAMKR